MIVEADTIVIWRRLIALWESLFVECEEVSTCVYRMCLHAIMHSISGCLI